MYSDLERAETPDSVLLQAEIAVAALAGTAFYGIVAWIERRVTFWHPSQRG